MTSDDDEPPQPSTPPPTEGQEVQGQTPLLASKHRRFSILRRERMAIICQVEQLMVTTGMSRPAACKEVNIHLTMHLRWTKHHDEMMEQKKNPGARAVCVGRPSCLEACKEDLLRFIFENREQGMAVSVAMVMRKAKQIIPSEFGVKTKCAQYHSALRFVRSQSFVFCLGTNESQCAPAETAAEALDYIMNVARPKVFNQPGRHQNFILNMDQMPVPFTYNNSRKTIEVVGRRTVHVRKSTNDTKRATFAMMVTASGKILKPLIIFKGARNGRIVQREFPNYDHDMIYLCQANAWMDKDAMLVWVDQALRTHIESAPPGILPILFLDSYRCHMMASVVSKIQDLGAEVEHIPGGCTALCQPVDIGVNKPFKNTLRDQWEEWMVDEGLAHGTTSPPTRENIVVQWTRNAVANIASEILNNAWRHGDYSWFPPAINDY